MNSSFHEYLRTVSSHRLTASIYSIPLVQHRFSMNCQPNWDCFVKALFLIQLVVFHPILHFPEAPAQCPRAKKWVLLRLLCHCFIPGGLTSGKLTVNAPNTHVDKRAFPRHHRLTFRLTNCPTPCVRTHTNTHKHCDNKLSPLQQLFNWQKHL